MPDKKFRIAVDFDGTIVLHDFPNIGNPVFGAFPFLKDWRAKDDVVLILWTVRSGEYLEQAVRFCREYGVEFDHVNSIASDTWSKSPKAYANIYVDDAALGAPLIESPNVHHRPFLDWKRANGLLHVAYLDWKDGKGPSRFVHMPGERIAK